MKTAEEADKPAIDPIQSSYKKVKIGFFELEIRSWFEVAFFKLFCGSENLTFGLSRTQTHRRRYAKYSRFGIGRRRDSNAENW